MNLIKAFFTYLFGICVIGTVLGVISYTMEETESHLADYIYYPNVLQVAQLTFTGIVIGSIIFLGIGIIINQRRQF